MYYEVAIYLTPLFREVMLHRLDHFSEGVRLGRVADLRRL